MDINFQKFLRKKTLKYRRRNIIRIKQVLYLCTILLVAILILNFIRGLFSGGNKSNPTKVDSVNNNVSNNVKHDDQYYYDMIDRYLSKVDDSNIDSILNSYNNLGIIKCNGYINFRSEPNEKNTRSIIGLMNNGDALDILDWELKNNSVYCKVKSGGMTGYVAKQFVMTGDVAIEEAKKNAAVRAIVLVDKLRMRSEPNTDSDNVVGTTYKGERYKLISLENEWAKVHADNLEDVQTAYISADSRYLEIKYCLSEARTQDLKSDVLNYYDNIGVSTARDYINVRKTAKSNGTIIGKLPGKAGCEILGESGNFYKIKSGKVTGYVTKQYLATGKRAETRILRQSRQQYQSGA